MPIYLKQNTASQEVPLGFFVDSTDGNTEETGLTIANTDIKLWKTGATTLANKNSGGATHISNGIYYAVLDATDTDTLGPLVLFVHVTGALAVRLECVVLAANIYDSLIGGGDVLDVSTTQIAGAAVSTTTAQIGVNVVQISEDATAANNAESFFDGTGYAGTNNTIPTVTTVTNAVTAGTVSDKTGYALSAAGVQAIWDALTSALTTVNSIGKLLVDNINATISSRSSHAAADIWSVATRLLTAGTNIVLAKGTGVTGFNDPTAAENADAVWDEATTNHTTVGTFGEQAKTDIDAILADTGTDGVVVASINANAVNAAALATDAVTEIQSGLATTANVSAVETDTQDIQARLPAALVSGRMDSSIGSIVASVLSQIADRVIRRSFANAAASADGDAKTGRSLLGVIARLTNKNAAAAGTLTVYEADDTTALFTQTLTTDATADPVVTADTN